MGTGNARMHKFSPEGTLLLSWGSPGTGTGQFRVPHGVWIDKEGRVLVADRENDRVQVFTQEGEHLTTWPTKLIGPALFYLDDEDIVYIPEHNGGLVSILTLDGERLAQWGSEIHRDLPRHLGGLSQGHLRGDARRVGPDPTGGEVRTDGLAVAVRGRFCYIGTYVFPGAPVNGAVAQLGERFNGIEEVGGSSPPSSTLQLDTSGKLPWLACRTKCTGNLIPLQLSPCDLGQYGFGVNPLSRVITERQSN